MIKNLRHLRKIYNISQQKLADYLCVSQQSINKYENHNVEPDIKTLMAIADYFDISVDYLIGRDCSESKEKSERILVSENEKNLITTYRRMNEKQKDCITGIIDLLNMK